ncbi:hypothetical protein [Streptomyces sp. NPDC045251]|uniref:hypothetical protein n=1 Tax=unclassified Streptomyces TaxID=2593676 RepID=UPI003407B961
MASNEARSRGVDFVGHPTSGAMFGLSAWVPFLLTVAVVIREDGGAAGTIGLIMAAGGMGGLCGALSGG